MAITKEDLKKQSAEIKGHNDVLYEKFREDIKIIGEGWDTVREKTEATFEIASELKEKTERMSDKLDATFEIVGEMKIDIEIIKSDISFIKQELKQKADRDELTALEKRVIFLENKLKRVY